MNPAGSLNVTRPHQASYSVSVEERERYQRTRFFSSLDGLRAASILAVIWHHTIPPILGFPLLREGKRGVSLFFVVSGFLIVTLLLRTKERKGVFSIGKFWGRRALRILPIYYTVLLTYVILVWGLEHDPEYRRAFFGDLPAFLTFTSNWFVNLNNPRVIFYFSWSLAAEEQFYLVWPWFERFLKEFWALFAVIVALLITQTVAAAMFDKNPSALPFVWRAISSVPVAILLGVALAHLLHNPNTFRMLFRISGRRGSAATALLLLLVALSVAHRIGLGADFIVAIAMMFLVSTCVIREDNDLARALSNPTIVWIGRISYGMYLFHMLAVNIVRRLLSAFGFSSPVLDFVGGVALAIAIASLSYVIFESPLLRLKSRFFKDDAGQSPAVVGQTLTA